VVTWVNTPNDNIISMRSDLLNQKVYNNLKKRTITNLYFYGIGCMNTASRERNGVYHQERIELAICYDGTTTMDIHSDTYCKGCNYLAWYMRKDCKELNCTRYKHNNYVTMLNHEIVEVEACSNWHNKVEIPLQRKRQGCPICNRVSIT